MPEPDKTPRRSARLERLAWGVGIALIVGVGIFSMPDSAPPELEAPAPTSDAEPEARSERVEQEATSPETPLPPNGRLVLDATPLADGRPLTVHFALPEPSRDGEPRPVRLISQPDHRILELDGALSEDRTTAAVEIDPTYLRPGVYLVEVRTTELSHFPLRRYGIVVRD
jgi:hypothetical protein